MPIVNKIILLHYGIYKSRSTRNLEINKKICIDLRKKFINLCWKFILLLLIYCTIGNKYCKFWIYRENSFRY